MALKHTGGHSVSQAIGSAADAAARALPLTAGPVKWTVIACLSGFVGLVIGAVSLPVIEFIVAPAWKLLADKLNKR